MKDPGKGGEEGPRLKNEDLGGGISQRLSQMEEGRREKRREIAECPKKL